MKTFASVMERLSGKNSLSNVFRDFLEMSVCALSLGAKEERYLEIVRRYDKPEVYELAEAFSLLVMEMDNGGEGLKDCFGDFFMEYLSFGRNGQFFTPEPICEMMARITGEIHDGAKVYDCACGSGRTLLAAAKINRRAYFFGSDIDMNCCLMTVINLCLNGLLGEVAWMDSLTNKFYGGWRIELHHEHCVPYIREIGEDECFQVMKIDKEKKEMKAGEVEKEMIPDPVVFAELPEVIKIREIPVQGSLF